MIQNDKTKEIINIFIKMLDIYKTFVVIYAWKVKVWQITLLILISTRREWSRFPL